MKVLYILVALIALTLHLTPPAYGADAFLTAENESGGVITLFSDDVPQIIQDRKPGCLGARMATSTNPIDGRDIFGCWRPTDTKIVIYWILSGNTKAYPFEAWEIVNPQPRAKPRKQSMRPQL